MVNRSSHTILWNFCQSIASCLISWTWLECFLSSMLFGASPLDRCWSQHLKFARSLSCFALDRCILFFCSLKRLASFAGLGKCFGLFSFLVSRQFFFPLFFLASLFEVFHDLFISYLKILYVLTLHFIQEVANWFIFNLIYWISFIIHFLFSLDLLIKFTIAYANSFNFSNEFTVDLRQDIMITIAWSIIFIFHLHFCRTVSYNNSSYAYRNLSFHLSSHFVFKNITDFRKSAYCTIDFTACPDKCFRASNFIIEHISYFIISLGHEKTSHSHQIFIFALHCLAYYAFGLQWMSPFVSIVVECSWISQNFHCQFMIQV